MIRPFTIAAVLCCLHCAPAETVTQHAAAPGPVKETEKAAELEPCEPGTAGASVIPERDARDFRYRIAPGQLETPTERARPMRAIEVEYTERAISHRIQGLVILEVAVRADGTVAGARALKGLPCGLEDNAIDAVSATEFFPGTLHGESIDSLTTVSVKFDLPVR